ncbi:unnamed protein product [Malus baccata var. baccata]
MERYYKKQCLNPPSNISGGPSPSNIPSSPPPPPSNIPRSPPSNIPSRSQQSEATELDLDEILANLPADPAHRRRMIDYPPNYREAIRRHYLQIDPCQPRDHIMPRKVSDNRCFIIRWFDKFKWLEYSISKNAAFCRYCYLFKCDFDQMGSTGSDVFTEIGFTNWKKGPENLRVHEGGVGSLHNKAVQQARDLMTQKQHIETFVIKQTDEGRINYHTLLSASLECTRWLLGQGLPFRGHDESLKSSNRGNYLELMQFLSKHNEQVRNVVFENAPKNLKYTSSDIQKDLVRACAIETVDAITKDMEGAFFSLLVDGARDSSTKEQMAVVLRYVNKKGEAIEKFLGVQHVSSTTSSSLEEAIERLFATTNLSMSKLRGQSYDGASNMKVVVEVVEWIKSDRNQDNLGEATRLFKDIQTFDFAFHLFLMRLILGITNELSQALQKKDQDIVNAMALVEVCKQRLQSLRDDDFGYLLQDVEKFCEEHDIIVPNMEDLHFVPGKSRRKAPKITNFHYYRVDLYFQVLDMQLKELNDRFNEMHSEFSSLRGISDLAKELVKTGRCESYMLVYKLLTLALVLPVATASVERAFSAMKIVKTPLRNKMGDQWLSDSMLVYIEKDVFAFIDNESIMRRFHDMKPRRQRFSPLPPRNPGFATACGVMGLMPQQKITAALRMLVYGASANQVDEITRMGKSTILEALMRFCGAVKSLYTAEYLRKPTRMDLQRLLKKGEM